MVVPKTLLVLTLALGQVPFSSGQFQVRDVLNGVRFLDCDPAVYYEYLHLYDDPSQVTREGLQALLRSRHRTVVPAKANEEGGDDVYAAVMDLDGGKEAGTVHLVYRNTEVDATTQANVWEVGRLWPLPMSMSALVSAFTGTDVHHLRPMDTTVLEGKTSIHFGLCNTVQSVAGCRIPATENTNWDTAWDTAQDDKIWQPSQSKRGEIARALLYMDLRYNELNLQDCEPFGEGQLGYLSQILQWHNEYPPTATEIQRNNRACSRWQGNRNPFVDYPQLATTIYGDPQQLDGNTRTYPKCDGTSNSTESSGSPGSVFVGTDNTSSEKLPSDSLGTTNTTESSDSQGSVVVGSDNSSSEKFPSDSLPSHTPSGAPSVSPSSQAPSICPSRAPSASPSSAPSLQPTATDDCAAIGEGSLPFFLVNTRDPDEVIILALDKIPGGVELFLTDQAWDGADLIRGELDEGVLMMTTPEEGIPAGLLFGYGPSVVHNERWTQDEGTFSLGLDGDNIFLYCLDRFNEIRFLSAFTNSGDWQQPNLDFAAYGRNSSALPESVENASLALPHLLNYHYNGPRDARVKLLQRSIFYPNEWEGSDELRYYVGEVEEEEGESSGVRASLLASLFLSGLVFVFY